ncbi:MAG: hypothetical protein WBN24_11750, partial [Acidimicrobiia bacterium]
ISGGPAEVNSEDRRGQEAGMDEDVATRCCGCSYAALCWVVPTLLLLILVIVSLCALKSFGVIG